MGTPRPHRTNEKDALGRAISVSDRQIDARSSAPPPHHSSQATAEWKDFIDLAADIPPAAAPMQYVICVRHPDHGNEFRTFGNANADGQIEIIDIDLGASFDGCPDNADQAADWAQAKLGEAMRITDRAARDSMLTIISGVLDDAADCRVDVDDIRAAVAYAGSKPVRRTNVTQLALHFDPGSIVDHFDGYDGDDDDESQAARWVSAASSEQLYDLADQIAGDDRLYHAWHHAMIDAINQRISEGR